MTTDSENAGRLEQEIARTRADIDLTLDAIQEKLSPGQILDRVLDYTKENGGAFAGNLGRSVRDNPLPVALLGIGMSWLMFAGRKPGYARQGSDATSDYESAISSGDYMPDEGEGMQPSAITETGKAKARDWAEGARQMADTASSRAGAVSQSTRKVTGQMKDRAQHARASAGQFIEENPLILGALAVAAGAALGGLIPVTARENEVLGTTSDRVKETVGAEMREMAESAKSGVAKAKSGGDSRFAPEQPSAAR